MKNIKIYPLILLFVMMASGDLFSQNRKTSDTKVDTLKIWASMDCVSCQAKIQKNIAFEKGVKDLKVDLPTKMVVIAYRKDKTTPEKLDKAIQDLGFKTEMLK